DREKPFAPSGLDLTPAGCAGQVKRRPAPARIGACGETRVPPQLFLDAGCVAEDDRRRDAVVGELRRRLEHGDGSADAVDTRLTERNRPLGELALARLNLGPKLGPAREPVATRDRQLCGRERDPVGDEPELAERFLVAALGGAQQVLCLMAEL